MVKTSCLIPSSFHLDRARGQLLELLWFSEAHPACFQHLVIQSQAPFLTGPQNSPDLNLPRATFPKEMVGLSFYFFNNHVPAPSLCCPQVLVSFLDTCSEGVLQESYLKIRFTFPLFQVVTQTSCDLVIISGTLFTLRIQYSHTWLFMPSTQLLSSKYFFFSLPFRDS